MHFSFFHILLLLALATVTVIAEKKIVCYVGTWAVYRPGLGRFDIENINPFLCTHLIYGFFGINEDGSIRIIDPYLDLEENWGRGHIKRFNALKSLNPSLKTMAAIGGWNEGSRKFSLVAANPALRRRFIEASISFCRKYQFDGVDLDWEYPAQRGGNETVDKENHAVWLQETRSAFDREGLLLSAAVASVEVSAAKSYDIPRVSAALHFINVMTYDMYGAWDEQCGLNAPMYGGPANVTEKHFTVDDSIHYWLSQGAPKEKIVMGIPLYGRSFTLANADNTDIGAAASGPGIAGPYSREVGVMGYNELCEAMLTEQWKVHFDDEQFGFYATKGNQWVGYDNPTSVAYKVNYAKDLDLGGVMVWSLETDDFRGVCNERNNVLMNTIYATLHDGSEPPTTISTTSATKEPNNCVVEGSFPNPGACEKYYVCTADGNRYDFTCPSGLHYDPVNKICNWPELVNCKTTKFNELLKK